MPIEVKELELKQIFEYGLYFHGHLCLGMPLGLRAGLLARRKLGVKRAKDKELFLLAETGTNHAMACFLDGLMIATGCTCGKGNVQKLDYGKLAFTLINQKNKMQIRISVKPEFILQALKTSSFIAKRKRGIRPQDVELKVIETEVNKILNLPEEDLFIVGSVHPHEYKAAYDTFEAYPCEQCGEVVYANWIRIKEGRLLCIPCSKYEINPP